MNLYCEGHLPVKEFTKVSLLKDLKRSLPSTLKESISIEHSFNLAFDAHAGQWREARNRSAAPIPYIVHPVGVAKLVITFWLDGELSDTLETLVCAALLHDVMEDAPVRASEIAIAASTRCAELVLALTKPEVRTISNHIQRNEQFIRQIKEAGISAIYLKICDSIHNLSRPSSMPTSLLRKTVDKAKGPYTQLLFGTPFEERLKAALSTQISDAQESLELSDSLQQDQPQVSQLHRYLEALIQKSKGKELEFHDVAGILLKLPGVIKCEIGNLQSSIANCLAADYLASPELISRIATELEAHGFVRLGELNELNGSATDTLMHLFGCAFSFSNSWVCLLVDLSKAPDWFCFPAVKAIITLLSDRIAKRLAGEVFEFTEKMWEQFSLDPRTLLNEDLGRQDIARLVDAVEMAEFAAPIVRRGLESFIRTSKYADQVDRIEGRVKAFGSIIRKLRHRSIKLEEIDDLVGLRIIMVSPFARDYVANTLHQTLQLNRGTTFCVVPIDPNSITLDDVASGLGYIARHLRFKLLAANRSVSKINCEIQVRTIQEDAWARISESLVYKNRSLSKRKSRQLLEQLAQLRDQADRQIDVTQAH
jgi:ppGpp synthetase/RelA/SpoT-type nucleotidyltranferase